MRLTLKSRVTVICVSYPPVSQLFSVFGSYKTRAIQFVSGAADSVGIILCSWTMEVDVVGSGDLEGQNVKEVKEGLLLVLVLTRYRLGS